MIAVPTTVCCAWRWSLVARGLGVGVPLPRGGRGVLPLAVPQHHAARRGRSATCTGPCATAARPATSAGGCARSPGSASAGQVVQVVLAVAVLLAAAVAGAVVRAGRRVVALACRGRSWSLVPRAAAQRRVCAGRARSRRPRADLRAGLLARRALAGHPLASALVVAGHVADLPGRRPHRRRRRRRPAQLLPLALLVLLAMGIPANVAGWGPREGVAAWAFAAAGLGARPGRRDRGRVRRDGARRQPARRRGAGRGVGRRASGARDDRPAPAASRAALEGAAVAERPYTAAQLRHVDRRLPRRAATDERLLLSNDADFDRVDAVRAGCDAILVGAATVRNDNPRLLVRAPARAGSGGSRGACRRRRSR